MLAFAITAAARLVRAVTSSGLLEMGRPVPAGWQRAPRGRRARDAHVTDEFCPCVMLVYCNFGPKNFSVARRNSRRKHFFFIFGLSGTPTSRTTTTSSSCSSMTTCGPGGAVGPVAKPASLLFVFRRRPPARTLLESQVRGQPCRECVWLENRKTKRTERERESCARCRLERLV